MQANNFWKTLLGTNAQVFVSKAVAYTDDVTMEDFVANAVEGEFGFFLKSDNTVLAGNAEPPANVEIYVGVMRDGQVETSVAFKTGEVEVSKTPYEAPVKQVSNVVVSALTVAAGNVFGIQFLETTPGYQPFPTFAYEITAVAGDTVDTAMAKLLALINSTTTAANKNRDLLITATYTNGTNTLECTAKSFGQTFRVQLRGVLADGGAATTYTTKAKLGSGFPSQVRALQSAGDIFKGVTTNYPLQGATAADFGAPTDFVDNALTYTLYSINGNRSENSKSPTKTWIHNHTIILAVPAADGADTEVATVLGVA